MGLSRLTPSAIRSGGRDGHRRAAVGGERPAGRQAELGATFIETAANYGAGHSEEILGRAFAGHRDAVVLATKFGYRVDEARRAVSEGPIDVRAQLTASLRRLGTDYVDVYQLHVGDLPPARALDLVEGSSPTWCAARAPSRSRASRPSRRSRRTPVRWRKAR